MMHMIVDGMNFFIRAFTSNPSMDVNGEHCGGTVGFLLGINKLVRENCPDRVIVVWDGEGGSIQRRKMFKDYKAGRKPRFNREYDRDEDKSEQLESFRTQLESVIKYLSFLPITVIRVKGIEADDVIAYLVNFMLKREDKKLIISSDRDFYQLIDENTSVYTPTQKKYVTTGDIVERFSVLPENYVYMKAMIGDGSDNIRGIKGIGPKTFSKLFPFVVERRTNIDEIFEHANENRDKKEKYKEILDSRGIVIENIRLMQLSSPLMSPMAASAIRFAFCKHVDFMPVNMKMSLSRDGLQIKAADFFAVFKDLSFKTSRIVATQG